MAQKKKRESGGAGASGTELGFAAFLHLRDSTYVWNQTPDLAEEALASLARVVATAAKSWHGRVGSFTGGGFVVLFPMAEHAIGCVAAVIEGWEPHRQAVCKALALLKAEPPDERSLMVRAGVAHGQYRFFELFSQTNVGGEAINRASRCEEACKAFFAVASLSKSLAIQQRIFVTQDVFNLIENKGDFWHSKKLAVEFPGYERPPTGGLVTTPDHIVAVWPKVAASVGDVPRAAEGHLLRATRVANRVEAADRLLSAGAARPNRDALLRVITSYREALSYLPEDDFPLQRGVIHDRLGLAHAALAEVVPPSQKRGRLDEALQEFKTALALLDSDEDPEQFGATNSNIAAIRRRQAELVAPAERAHYLTEAMRALRDVLQTGRYIADPNRHSIALSSLALVLGSQADYLSDDAKESKWAEAADVLRRALAVTTPSANPHHYASVQSDLSNALRMEARQLDGDPTRESLLASSEAMARDAARALTPSAPSRYANAQVNLGLVLLDRAQMTSNTEAMLMLAEAADSFKQALKVNDSKEYWLKRAHILENLALALQLQAALLRGGDRTKQIQEAQRASEQALKIYRETDHSDAAERVEKTIRKIASAAETA